MYTFGAKSQAVLFTVDPMIQLCCYDVLKVFNFSCLSGARGKDEQDGLYDDGKSTKRFPDSKHNKTFEGRMGCPAGAIDVAPYPVNWDDPKPFILLAGHMFQAAGYHGIKLRWGGNWDGDLVIIDDQNFDDLGHFERIG